MNNRPHDGSRTRFSHQVLDQLAHAFLGACVQALWASIVVYIGWPLWIGIPLAYSIGVLREKVQWRSLHTPSLLDSAIDATFWPIGAAVLYFIWSPST